MLRDETNNHVGLFDVCHLKQLMNMIGVMWPFFSAFSGRLFLSCLGVKFSSSTKEFTVAIPGKGNAVFNLEKKVTNAHRRCYDMIFFLRRRSLLYM